MSNPMKDNTLQMGTYKSEHTFYSKCSNENKDEEIRRVIDELMEHMFEKSPVVPIDQRRSGK